MVKTTTKLVGGLVLASLCAAGCGDDENVQKGTVNLIQAKSSVMTASGLRAQVDAKDGARIATAVNQLSASAGSIVTPAAMARALTVDGEDVVLAAVQAQMAAGSPACGESSCKFTSYNVGGQSLNGEVSWTPAGEGKRIKWSLTMKAASGGTTGLPVTGLFALDYSGTGDVTVTAAKLEGGFSTKATYAVTGTGSGQKIEGGWEANVKYRGVALTNGQPTGGSLYAKWKAYAMSGGQSGEQAYEGTADF